MKVARLDDRHSEACRSGTPVYRTAGGNDALALLAHELRSPLAAVSTALHLIRAAGPGDKVVAQAVAAIEKQVRYMTRLIEDQLDLARAELGKLTLSRESYDLALVVAEAIETSRPALDERRQELTAVVPPGPLHLQGDPTRIRQVLVNLLTNAARYTEPGGQIRLGVEAEGNEVVVRVRDTGVGIDPELLPLLFEPYVQGERSPEAKREGLGLGLALVKRVVELHGGSVEAFSPGPGQGSEFVVRLPRVRMQRDDRPAARPAWKRQACESLAT